jgi:hypothetical protein
LSSTSGATVGWAALGWVGSVMVNLVFGGPHGRHRSAAHAESQSV